MTGAFALADDYHVHSTFSDGQSTIGENVAAAAARGLRTICLTEHVRASTGWLPEFSGAVADLPRPDGLRVLSGVEAKILDMTGRLDMPADLCGVSLVLVADHQFPADLGPVEPADVRAALAAGQLTAADAVGCLAEATANAAAVAPRPLLAHLFSVLPKIGLTEQDIPDRLLAWLARRIAAAGALAEVNEKWTCPSPRSIRALARADVRLVASSDSHHCRDVGGYRYVRQACGQALTGAAG